MNTRLHLLARAATPLCSSSRLAQTVRASRSTRNASSYSPTEWLRKTLGGGAKEPEKQADIEAAKAKQIERGDASLFDTAEKFLDETPVASPKTPTKRHTEHKYSTASFKISHRKLNMLGRQIAGKPIDAAILQMVFSEKRASTRIKSMLCVARDHAEQYKNLDRSKLIVAESWVSKGEKLARVDIKGRGRTGLKHHPKARLTVVLREGKTLEEKAANLRKYRINKIRSAGYVREDVPIRNPGPMWAW